jgi:C4-dicarboxylate-specific signal transduction histidine kinase
MKSDTASDPAFARQRIAAVAAMSALLVHSGRNRLASVRMALELVQARMEAGLTDEQRASSLHQLDLFLDDFNLGTEMLRCHEGSLEAISVRQVATEAMETVRPRARKAGIALKPSYAKGLDDVKGDCSLLRVALLNVLRNAIEALQDSPPGGGAVPLIRLRAAASGRRCHLEIEDNGPGVPDAVYGGLFKDFVTGRTESAGLGLSICRDAMIVMGGSISYLTPRGERGARFRLELDFWPRRRGKPRTVSRN